MTNHISKLLWNVIIEVKVVPVLFLTDHHAMKAYCGNGCITPRILDLGTGWK
jgi:hypothetical protein